MLALIEYVFVPDYDENHGNLRNGLVNAINNSGFILSNFSIKKRLELNHYPVPNGLLVSFSFKNKRLGAFSVFIDPIGCHPDVKELSINEVFNFILDTVESNFKKQFKVRK